MTIAQEDVRSEVMMLLRSHKSGLSATTLNTMLTNVDVRRIRQALRELEDQGKVYSMKAGLSPNVPALWFIKQPPSIASDPVALSIWGAQDGPGSMPEPQAPSLLTGSHAPSLIAPSPEPEPEPDVDAEEWVASHFHYKSVQPHPERLADADPSVPEPKAADPEPSGLYYVRHLNRHLKPINAQLHKISFHAAANTRCGLAKTAAYCRRATTSETSELPKCPVCFGRISRPIAKA